MYIWRLNFTSTVPLTNGKRILFLAPQPFFELRGSSFRLCTTLEGLTSLGYRADVIAFPFGEEPKIEGIRLIRTPGIPGINRVPIGPSWQKGLFDLLLLFTALKQVRKNSYIAIHGVEDAGLIAALLSKFTKLPYIFDMHSCMSVQVRTSNIFLAPVFANILSYLERLSIRNATGVLTVADDITNYARGITKRAFCTTAEDVPLVQPDAGNIPLEASKLKGALNLNNKKVILYTGNFESYQGVEFLVRAFHKLKQKLFTTDATSFSQIALLIVGAVNTDHKTIKLRKLISKLDLDSSVQLIEARPAREMPVYMAVSDVLVSPRLFGANTPLKIYSYMTAKKPIVATNISTHTQVLDENTAILCDSSEDALSDAMLSALSELPDEISKRQRLVDNAYNRVQDKYSIPKFNEQIEQLYNFVLTGTVSRTDKTDSKVRKAIGS